MHFQCTPTDVDSFYERKPDSYAYIHHQARKSMPGDDPNINSINESSAMYSSYSYTFTHMNLNNKVNHSRSEKNIQNEDNIVNNSPFVTIPTRRHGICQVNLTIADWRQNFNRFLTRWQNSIQRSAASI